jgi:ribonucleotide monophosphatase NagD (HAD superfamily)
MNINYYNKYLKYKNKYFDLKKTTDIRNYDDLVGGHPDDKLLKINSSNLNAIDIFIFDMDGVMKGMTPELENGAIQFINYLYSKEKKLYWITNNPELSREEVIDDLLARGVNFGKDIGYTGYNKISNDTKGNYRQFYNANKKIVSKLKEKQEIYEENIDKILCVSYIISRYILEQAVNSNGIKPLIYSLQRSNNDLFINDTTVSNYDQYKNKGIIAELNKLKENAIVETNEYLSKTFARLNKSIPIAKDKINNIMDELTTTCNEVLELKVETEFQQKIPQFKTVLASTKTVLDKAKTAIEVLCKTDKVLKVLSEVDTDGSLPLDTTRINNTIEELLDVLLKTNTELINYSNLSLQDLKLPLQDLKTSQEFIKNYETFKDTLETFKDTLISFYENFKQLINKIFNALRGMLEYINSSKIATDNDPKYKNLRLLSLFAKELETLSSTGITDFNIGTVVKSLQNMPFKIIHYKEYIKGANSDVPTYDMIYNIIDKGYNTLITGWDGEPDPKFMLLLGNIIYILESIGYKFDIIVCSPDLSGSNGEIQDTTKDTENITDEIKKDIIDRLNKYMKDGTLKKRAIGTGSTGNFFTSISSISKKITYLGKPSEFLVQYINDKLFNGKDEGIKSKSLMIGDTYNTDISFGNKLGIKTLLVYSGATTKSEMNRYLKKINGNSTLMQELKELNPSNDKSYDTVKDVFENLGDPSYKPTYIENSLKDIFEEIIKPHEPMVV